MYASAGASTTTSSSTTSARHDAAAVVVPDAACRGVLVGHFFRNGVVAICQGCSVKHGKESSEAFCAQARRHDSHKHS